MEPINVNRKRNDFSKEVQVALDDIIHSMRSGLYAADNDGNISFANRAFAAMFRFENEKDVVGINLADRLYSQRNDRAVFLKSLNEKGFVSDYRIQMVRRDGSRVIVIAQSNLLKNKTGKVVGVEGILKELPEERVAAKESKFPENAEIIAVDEKAQQDLELLVTDPLTGLYNYQYFIRCLDFEVKRSNRFLQPLCMMMIDIDNFHIFNNQYGRENGDDLLKKAGAIFQENLRETDIVCRQSQDQFSVILPATTKVEALAIAKKVKDALQKTAFQETVTCSMGMSRYIPGMTTQELLLKANLGLYMAKETGKNEACLYG
ncbi:MAG: diguanylate cyclase [Candidatus Omnitrophota bacterium]|jgi:diguanylate cyclase (GGDEF)-like protein/PAS domain S-box-containing protein